MARYDHKNISLKKRQMMCNLPQEALDRERVNLESVVVKEIQVNRRAAGWLAGGQSSGQTWSNGFDAPVPLGAVRGSTPQTRLGVQGVEGRRA
jgi:hypothetical protein